MQLWNVFAQDTMSLSSTLKLTLGMKFEHNKFSDWEPQPDVRLACAGQWYHHVVGCGVRAVRTPTPLDVDVVERVGGVDFLVGNPDFQSETVIAYETGFRASVTPTFNLSMSAFYNRYDDLRTVEISDTPNFPPLMWGNLMKGDSWGITAWARWQVNDHWRLEPGLAMVRKDLHFKDGASELTGTAQAGNDPRAHALLKSSLDLGRDQTFDMSLRHVAASCPILRFLHTLN